MGGKRGGEIKGIPFIEAVNQQMDRSRILAPYDSFPKYPITTCIDKRSVELRGSINLVGDLY